jgi:transposase
MHEACISKLPRFQPIDRTQIFLRTTDVESLIAEDHPVRAIWIFLERLDLSKFSEEQRAVEGSVGRSSRSIANAHEWRSFLTLGSKANAACDSSDAAPDRK